MNSKTVFALALYAFDAVGAVVRFPVTPSATGTGFTYLPESQGINLLSDDYAMTVEDRAAPVRACCVSAMPFNRSWPGHQRSFDQTETASWFAFESDGPTRFEVKPNRPFKRCTVRPLSAGIKPVVEKSGQIRFTLPKCGYYVLELDDEHKALHLFMERTDDFPAKAKATKTFGPGIHAPGLVRLKSGDRVYIDRNAVVYGAFIAEGAEDVEIFGYGTVDSSILSRVFIGCSTPLQPGNLRFEKCRRVKVDGPVFLDSPGWCVTCVDCDDVEFARMKVVGQWRYNTDGVDIVNSRHVRLRDSFVRAFDDAVTIKGIPRCIDCPVRDVRVERCVLWCGWGRTCELGIETWAREYRDVVFEDCDLVHNSCTALDLRMGGTATLEHIVFRNLRVEFQAGLPEIFQSSETMTYAPGENRQTAHFIHIENGKFVRPQEPHGNVSDIRFENIDAIVEPGARNPDIVLMSSHGKFGPISFSNLKLNETPVRSLAAFPLHTNEASTANLTFR